MSESLGPEEDTSTVAARLERITRSFGDLTVIDGLSLEIPANAITTVVGPNGSGKTTLVRILAGVLPPDAGDRSLLVDVERPVGYSPQTPQFRPSFPVEETLQFYADYLASDVAVEDTMERVGLTTVADRRIDALWGDEAITRVGTEPPRPTATSGA